MKPIEGIYETIDLREIQVLKDDNSDFTEEFRTILLSCPYSYLHHLKSGPQFIKEWEALRYRIFQEKGRITGAPQQEV